MEVTEMKDIIMDHEDRLKSLEYNYSKLEGKLLSVENGQIQLENTILKTSQDQNLLLNKLIDNTFDLNKTKLIGRKEVWIAVLGGGGALGAVVAVVSKLL